ncbi:hypothetical protein [Bradyrhizobium sp.]|jgi:hypothetical protein|uniref:hypothetical protein n=1 Tax=Bradyrhizobium sp. TaxID=376 RepID=UPI002DDDBBC6|nr:hypothetical protein [Bradyrhizobium sp.]HEV2160446.1 hypothetical protein [Bradyrhizobium sp.]
MSIVYLDQNKWIELARAAKYPAQHPIASEILTRLFDGVAAGTITVPLTFANMYETQKINDSRQRHELAFLQASLSKGLVFRGRFKRLEIELSDFVRSAYGLPAEVRVTSWFLSDIFFEAVAEAGDSRILSVPERVVSLIKRRPAALLYDYLMNTPEDVRRYAVVQFSEGAERLRQRIEARRARDGNESLAMRRRIYSAIMMVDDMDFILSCGLAAGAPWRSISDMGSSLARRMIVDVPAYYVEREITLRLESQNRPIDENDFRDMQAFGAVMPYADYVVAENQFSNLAMQARLGKKYNTAISTDIRSLEKLFAGTSGPERSPVAAS